MTWALYDTNNKNPKKRTVHNPKQIPEKIEHQRGSKVIIEMRDNELIIHPLVSNPIIEGYGLFGKETLDSRELKMFAETLRVISKV